MRTGKYRHALETYAKAIQLTPGDQVLFNEQSTCQKVFYYKILVKINGGSI